jgi:putative transposase
MPNHYHLEVEELRENGISTFLHRLGTGYTNYFNKKYDRQGALFQGPFKAVLIKNDFYLKHLSVYINVVNPLDLTDSDWRERGVKNLENSRKFIENYKWCSYPDYVGLRKSNKIIERSILGKLFSRAQDYKRFAEEYLEGKQGIDFLTNLILE